MHILRFHELASASCDCLHPDMLRCLEELEALANNRQIVEISALRPGAPVPPQKLPFSWGGGGDIELQNQQSELR